MNKSVNLNVLAIVLATGLLISGCANFNLNLPFFSNYKVPDDPPRAQFLHKRQLPVKDLKAVLVKAPLHQTINMVEEAIISVTDTTTYIVKNDADTSANSRQDIKIRSNTFQFDDVSKLKKYFYTGNYVIKVSSFDVRPQRAEYYVEVSIQGGLNGYTVKPKMKGFVNWDLYKYRPQKGDTLKIPAESEPYFGIGSYLHEVEETYVNFNNKEKTFTYWKEDNVDDEPISMGIMEADVRSKLIEYAALRDITAYTK